MELIPEKKPGQDIGNPNRNIVSKILSREAVTMQIEKHRLPLFFRCRFSDWFCC